MILKGVCNGNPLIAENIFDFSGNRARESYIRRPALNLLNFRGFGMVSILNHRRRKRGGQGGGGGARPPQ